MSLAAWLKAVFHLCTISGSIPYIGWINMIENWYNNLSMHVLAFNNLHKFFKAPSWRRIVFWENDNHNIWSFELILKSWWDFVSSLEFIVNESYNLFWSQSFMEMTSETVASVVASETEEMWFFAWRFVEETDEEEDLAINSNWWLSSKRKSRSSSH